MEFDALSAEDYALGQAMLGYLPGSVSSLNVASYPDSIPAGNGESYSNGWSASTFTDALKGVSSSIADVAKTVYGIENAANTMSLQRLQLATAQDVTRTQLSTARDVALAQSATEAAKAQAVLAQAQQAAKLNTQLAAGGSSNVLVLGLLAFGAYLLAKNMGGA